MACSISSKVTHLAGKLSKSKSLAGRISRVTFNRALSPALESGVFLDTDPHLRYPLLVNYLRAFDAALEDKRYLVRSAFFEAIFEVLDEIVRTAVTLQGNVKQESLQQVIAPLTRLDFTGVGSRQLLSKKEIVALIRATLRKSSPISGDML